jgi:hypothetical protein
MTTTNRNNFVWDAEMVKKYQDISIMFNVFLVTECSPYIRGLQLIIDEIFGRWGFNPHVFNADKVLNRMTAVTPEVIAGELENLNKEQLAVLNHYINPILPYGNFIDIMPGFSYASMLEDVKQAYKYLEEFICSK